VTAAESTPPAAIYKCHRCGKSTPYRMMALLLCVECQPDCATCGKVGESGDDACANCWEVQRRLPEFLKSEAGILFVKIALAEVEKASES
jgi:hypothetical protein